MGRESREVWTKRVERWRDSGLSAKEFAAEVGINENSLRHWVWRLNAKPNGTVRKVAATVEPLQWVEVAAPATKEPELTRIVPMEKFELVLASGTTLRVPARFEAEALRRLLAVVG